MIKVKDIAYVRFAAPDLAKVETFLTDFGLAVHTGANGNLYSRGTAPSPYVPSPKWVKPVSEQSASKPRAQRISPPPPQWTALPQSKRSTRPAVDRWCAFTDPAGSTVEIVHGRELLEALPIRSVSPLNSGSRRQRMGELQRVDSGPACVKQLGHIYWCDPWGHVVEHFTDGDLLNRSHETALQDVHAALGSQWGRFG